MAGRRNSGHRAARAARFAAAAGDMEQLAAACDWFRASVTLLARRRPPRGVPQAAHAAVAARLARDAAAYLTRMADAIDRGDYDAKLRGTEGRQRAAG
jgi:hypothetical protein